MKKAIHIPTGKTVTLVEHVNVGEGWLCQPEGGGKIIAARYSELTNLDGTPLYTEQQLEAKRTFQRAIEYSEKYAQEVPNEFFNPKGP